jgi:hypothetical protein
MMMKISKKYRDFSIIEQSPLILNKLAKLEQKYNKDYSDNGTYMDIWDYAYSEEGMTDTTRDFIRYCYNR